MRQNAKTVSPMSNEGRNTYVIEHLTDSLLALLKEKPLAEISVSELCGSACVGRASFYRNFDSKEAILTAYISRLLSQWKSCCTEAENPPLSQVIGSLFQHFIQQKEFYRLLNSRHLVYLLKDAILSAFELKPELPKKEAYAKAYAAYALYGWIETWFQRGMKESAQEMRDLFREQGL